jgi:hypothetical protein
LHQAAKEIHEIEEEEEKEVKGLGYEAGPKKYEAPAEPPADRKTGTR